MKELKSKEKKETLVILGSNLTIFNAKMEEETKLIIQSIGQKEKEVRKEVEALNEEISLLASQTLAYSEATSNQEKELEVLRANITKIKQQSLPPPRPFRSPPRSSQEAHDTIIRLFSPPSSSFLSEKFL